MSWISGQTISPSSGELVFTIDADCNLPRPQNWEQLWQTCKGIPPFADREEAIPPESLEFEDGLVAPVFGACECRKLSEEWGQHLISMNDTSLNVMDFQEAEPDSACTTTRRIVTFGFANFHINDDGESIATTRGCIDRNCDEISIYLRTRGTNPARATLNAMFPDDFLRAICWQESRWAHFLPNGKPKFNVNTNGTTDWGLMQINEATNDEKWNWKYNLARGIGLFAEKRLAARRYLNSHPEEVTEEMLENETIQRYNGGRHYVWDAASGVWIARPANGYVASVRAIVASRPWAFLNPSI